MKISAIRSLSRDEIVKELAAQYRKEAVSLLLKNQPARNEKTNTAARKTMKKTIARLLTVQKARELTGELSS